MKRWLFPLMVCFFLSSVAQASDVENLKRDGFLRLYHSHLKDYLEIAYEKDGKLIPEALQKINHFMRSRDSEKDRDMNVSLIRLLDHLQDHFKADTVEVICGFRTEEFNHSLKKAGHNVYEDSYHIQGMASDIHLDEVKEADLEEYARSLGLGGVGFYPNNNMVHVDFGPKRQWQEGTFANRRNIGEFNKDLSVSLTTDQLFYSSGDTQKLALANPERIPLEGKWVLEWFHRTRWAEAGFLELSSPNVISADSMALKLKAAAEQKAPEVSWKYPSVLEIPYGKFRWKLSTQDGRVQFSNEFYLKKK